MRDLIKKILREELERKVVISEMAKYKTYCQQHFNSISPELPFCTAAEEYIKDEFEMVGKKKINKVIFSKFRSGIVNFYQNIADEILEIKIEQLTELSEIVKNGMKEIEEANKYLKKNCSNIEKIANKELENFKEKTVLYFSNKEGIYHVTNRLDTNYSAMAVLFTKFFSNKGAFDGVKYGELIPWDKIAKNWIEHSFNPSIKFIDIRPKEEQDDTSAALTSLEFQELAKIYFSNNITYKSSEIRKAVEQVLHDVRSRGFESENEFEQKYLKDKGRTYVRYAKDYGFVDRFLGVDYIYKKAGEDYYVPVQVKSSPKESTYLINSLGCETYVIAAKSGASFDFSTKHSKDLKY
jgi:hypothetical protein